MNKIYDKLLLALAVLVLLAGVGFYLVKSTALSSAQLQYGKPVDHPYQTIPVRQASGDTATWPEATEQAPGELYDVFTPPKIYIDKNGTFKFTPPYVEAIAVKAPFGLYLADIQRDAYRIQLEGYIEEDLIDASKSLLLLFNEETQSQVRARVGDEKVEAEFKLLDFTIDRLRDENNNPYKVVKAKLLDQRTGEQVVLKHGERLMTDRVTVVLRSDEDPSVEIELNEAPTVFETSTCEYLLLEINLEESSVTVDKIGQNLLDVEIEVLYLRKTIEETPAPTSTPSSAFPETDQPSQLFDFAF